jgi:hypothetical protein
MVRASLLPVAFCLAVGLVSAAGAQTTSERGASILIFPKVVADSTGDTVLQVANLLESRVDVLCTYVDGTSWDATTFTLSLLAEQPVQWVASRGRTASGGDDTNDVPAAPASFTGELVCVEVDVSGAPATGNRLVGRATVTTLADGDALAYAAVGLTSTGLNDLDDTLCIGEPSDLCLFGSEYDACPAAWLLAHPSDGAPDEQLGDGATQTTRLVVVPCSQNVRDATPAEVNVLVRVTNEFEQVISGTAHVTCWSEFALTDLSPVFTAEALGSAAVQTRLRPSVESGAFVVLAERQRRAAGGAVVSTDALVPQQEGAAQSPDAIILPMGPRP